MNNKYKIIAICICLMLVTVSIFVVSGKKPPQEPKNYTKYPAIDAPDPPDEGFIVFCDSADGNLKALDIYGQETILAIPQTPIGYRIGMWSRNNLGYEDYYMINLDDDNAILRVLNYDETGVICNPNHMESNWDEIVNELDFVDYTYLDGISFSGSDNNMYLSVISGEYFQMYNYTIQFKFNTGGDNCQFGVCFNYIDLNNYENINFEWHPNIAYRRIHYEKWEDGVPTYQNINFDMATNTDYLVKVKVDNTIPQIDVYVDDILEWVINPPIEYKVGLFNGANGVSSRFISRTYNDCILNITGDVDFKITKDEANWDVIEQAGDASVDYTYPTGIYFIGDSNTGAKYRALGYNNIPYTSDYSVEMKVQFVGGWGSCGFYYNYIDDNNFGRLILIYERAGMGGVYFTNCSDGVHTNIKIDIDLSPTEYVIKANVDNTNGFAYAYLDGILVYSLDI